MIHNSSWTVRAELGRPESSYSLKFLDCTYIFGWNFETFKIFYNISTPFKKFHSALTDNNLSYAMTHCLKTGQFEQNFARSIFKKPCYKRWKWYDQTAKNHRWWKSFFFLSHNNVCFFNFSSYENVSNNSHDLSWQHTFKDT